MDEKKAESSAVNEVINGDTHVSDDILQHMRRGLFGKSAGSQENSSSPKTVEFSNGSIMADVPMENGTSFEDQQAAASKRNISNNDIKEPVITEEETLHPKDEPESVQSETTPVIEEPQIDPVTDDDPMDQSDDINNASNSAEDVEITELPADANIPSNEQLDIEPVIDSPEEENNQEVSGSQQEDPDDLSATKKEQEELSIEEKEEEEEAPKSSKRNRRSINEPKVGLTPKSAKGRRIGRNAVKEESPTEEAAVEEAEEEAMEMEEPSKEKYEKTPNRKRNTEAANAAEEIMKSIPKRNLRRKENKEGETPKKEETSDEEEEIKKGKKIIRRSSKKEEEEEETKKSEKEDEAEEQNTPRSTRRGKRGATAVIPVSKAKKQKEEEKEKKKEETEKPEEKEEVLKTTRSTRRSTRGATKATPLKVNKGKQEVEEKDESEEEEEKEEQKTPRSSRRGQRGATRASNNYLEEEKEDSESPAPTPRSLRRRGGKVEENTTPATPTRGRGQKKAEPQSKNIDSIRFLPIMSCEIDPYDVDTQFDEHPDPLRNVVMSTGPFGSQRYSRIGSGKYTSTEKAAEGRIGNLSGLTPKQINRRSLADLAPGRRKNTPKGTKSAPPARNRKDSGSDEEMDVDQPTSSKATPTSRKRRTSPAPTSSKKVAVEIPQLTIEEQWKVDHPRNEHAPIEVGAKVYAVFDKIYYPAVVIAERDGLGRYKVQFEEDKLVRDIPAQGVIPLRAVVEQKECYYGDEGAIIINAPNVASVEDWAEAMFTVKKLGKDGEPKGEDIRCTWSKLSLDMNDWKNYIHQKSIEATAVATDNIASSRTRRHQPVDSVVSPLPVFKPNRSTKKKAVPQNEDGDGNDDRPEQECDCFSGMVFLLTSAQRDGNTTFKKKLLHDYIVERHGTIVEDIAEMETYPEKSHFLIADTFYRTHKYLSALARGVPCVSHEWIHKCIETESAVDYHEYILPAGVSNIDGELYQTPVNYSTLLQGKNILLNSENPNANPKAVNYFHIWEPLVRYMGGRGIKKVDELNPDERLDVILTDYPVTGITLERAQQDKTWVVSSEWLIHVIIMDRVIDPAECPRLKIPREGDEKKKEENGENNGEDNGEGNEKNEENEKEEGKEEEKEEREGKKENEEEKNE